MTTEKQFAACAELDGITITKVSISHSYEPGTFEEERWIKDSFIVPKKDYDSRDVLIPLILKCDKALIVDVEVVRKHKLRSALEASIEQLREELLRATNKWT